MNNLKKIKKGHYENDEYIIKKDDYGNSRFFYTAWRITRKVDGKYCDCNSLKAAKEFAQNPLENLLIESK